MVLLNSFSTSLMLSAANVALPAIAEDLGLGAVALSWVPMAYLMASAMFVLVFSRLSDSYGRKRFFMIGTAAVIVSSCLAAASFNGGMLLSARFLQGVSASMLYATQMAIVSSVFPANRRGRAIGIVAAVIYIGLASGPLLGGYVIDRAGWRPAFLLQVPLAIVVLLLGRFRVSAEWKGVAVSRFDLRGALLYACSILFICLGVSRLPETIGFLGVVAGVAAMLVFLGHARRAEEPIWDVRLFFSNRVFTLSCAASLIMYSTTYANVMLLSLYLQYIKGMTATAAGLLLMTQPAIMAVLSPIMGRLSDRIEPRLLASSGMAITAAGLLMLAMLDGNSSTQYIVLALLMTGAGFSLFSSPNANAIMGSVEARHYGSASGAVATTRLLGQLSSIVLVTLAMTLIMGAAPLTPENYPLLQSAIQLSLGIAAALCLPGIVLSLVRGRVHLQKSEMR